MQKYIIHAVVITAMVVVTVFLLRKVPVVGSYVDRGLTG